MNTRLPLDWLNEHREEVAQRVAVNVERDRKRARDCSRRRRESDPAFRILCGLRHQLRHALIRGKRDLRPLWKAQNRLKRAY